MNPSPSQPDPLIDEQAATWAARLEGDVLEASERSALDAWLAESPEHRTALSDYCQFSADLEEQLPLLVSTGAVTMPAKPHLARRRWSFPRLASITFAGAAALAAVVWVARPAPQLENFATAIAERSVHTLADGTRIELNAHTSLRFENTKSERLVRLAGGEALFHVAKDHTRPFVVETPDGSVRVTGTTFNVRNDPAGATALEVTVVEGSVDVRPSESSARPPRAPYALVAGQQLAAGATGIDIRTLSASAVADSLAWREGRIVCEDMPLHEVAARFARYHGKRIVVHAAVANEKVGGIYGLDDLTAFLAALEVVLPVKTGYDFSGVVSINPRPGS